MTNASKWGDRHWQRVEGKQISPTMEILNQWNVRNKSKSSNVRQEETETLESFNESFVYESQNSSDF
jgi:hypothetical protein